MFNFIVIERYFVNISKNLSLLKCITAEEITFAWKVSQDLLPVGARIHRKNAERRCLRRLGGDLVCLETESLEHRFFKCKGVEESFKSIESILETFLGRNVEYNEIIPFSFNP